MGDMEERENVPESFEVKVSDVLAVDSGNLGSQKILSRTACQRTEPLVVSGTYSYLYPRA